MIGYSHTFHTILDCLVHKIRNFRLTIKNRIMSMHVQVDEIFHKNNVIFESVKLLQNKRNTK